MFFYNYFLQVFIIVLIISSCPTQEINAQQWQTVGARKFTTGRTTLDGKNLAVSNGTPYVAYSDNTDGFNLKVMKYDGVNWVDVGASTLPVGAAGPPSITSDNGTIYIAYQDQVFNGRNTVIKYDGLVWTIVGSRGFSTDEARFQFIAIYNGEPYVAFEDKGNSYESSVMKYDGTNWVHLGSPGFTTGHSYGQSIYNELAFDGATPYVIYMTVGGSSGSYTTRVMKYDGTNWVPVGTTGYNNAGSANQSIAFHNGEPYFSILDFDYFKSTVKKFDGSNWVNVGMPGFSAGMAVQPQIVIHNGLPYVAYRDFTVQEKLTVMYYDGNNWLPVGGSIGVSPEEVTAPSLVLDNNTLYVAFIDTVNFNSGKLSVMSYDIVTDLKKLEVINNSFEIFPNPATNIVTVETEEDFEFIAVLGISGEELKRTSENSIQVDELPAGTYLFQIKTPKGFGYKRFLKK